MRTHSINKYLLLIYLHIVVSSLVPIFIGYSPRWVFLDYVGVFLLFGGLGLYVFVDYRLNPKKYSWTEVLKKGIDFK